MLVGDFWHSSILYLHVCLATWWYTFVHEEHMLLFSSDLVDIYLDYLEEVQFTGLLQQKMYLLYRPGLGGVQGAQPG